MEEVEISVKKYRAIDGKLFDYKDECFQHERENCNQIYDILNKARDIKDYCISVGSCKDCVFERCEAAGGCVLYSEHPFDWKF